MVRRTEARIPGRPTQNPALVTCWRVDRDRAVRFIARALRRSGGSITRAADLTHVTRRTLTRWIKSSRELRQVVKECTERRGS